MNSTKIRAGVIAATIAGAGAVAALAGTGQAAAATPDCNSHQLPVASVDTASAAATICQWQGDGALEYRGVTKSTGDSITLPVTVVVPTGDGSGRYSFSAVNDGYTYRVDDQRALAITDPAGSMIFYERQ